MSEAWESFYPHIQPHVPGCPEIVIDDHLQVAAENFCKRSEVWRDRFSGLTTTQGEAEFYVPTTGSSRLENVLALYVDGNQLTRTTGLFADRPTTDTEGRPLFYSQEGDEVVRLYPTPDDAYPIEGHIVLMPSAKATSVPDFLYEDHLQTITYGAISTLAIIPNKEWTNPELATYYAQKFWQCVDDARGRDFRRSNLHVAAVPFA